MGRWRRRRQPTESIKNSEMKKTERILAALLLGLGISLSGCAPVAPWERGHLAKPHMALDPYPAQSTLREHIYGSREAASGGTAASGGGCGCY
jgi:hypothetical protein